jgi:hypothetical protein
MKNFIPYNMYIGHYQLSNSKQVRKEENAMLEYKFPQGKFRRNDPKGLISKHNICVSISWPHAHE